MDSELTKSVARSLDADPRLLVVIPELFADMDALGSDADAVVDALRGDVGPGSRVVDLGCGKGAVGIEVARRLGARVLGVDGMEAFVEEARGRATEAGVGALCEFRCGDVREVKGEFDAALLIGVYDALGGIAETVGAMRGLVREGGLMVIDDGFLVEARGAAEWARYRGLAETRRLMESYGDAIVAEQIVEEAEQGESDARLTALIRARAEGLSARRPELAGLLTEYVATQERASATLARTMRYAMWVLRRGR